MSTLFIERTFSAPLQRTYAHFADPSLLASWFWPDSFETAVELDAQPGGAWSISSAPNDMSVGGEFVKVQQERSLAFTWRWAGEEQETRVSIGFSATPDGSTYMALFHRGFATPEDERNHLEGWDSCLERLEEALNRKN